MLLNFCCALQDDINCTTHACRCKIKPLRDDGWRIRAPQPVKEIMSHQMFKVGRFLPNITHSHRLTDLLIVQECRHSSRKQALNITVQVVYIYVIGMVSDVGSYYNTIFVLVD